MAIRWKNIIKKIKDSAKRHGKMLAGIVLTVFGVFFFYGLIAYCWTHPTDEALSIGIIGNILLSLGIIQILNSILCRVYHDWRPVDASYYNEWRKISRKQQEILGIIGITALISACWYFSYIMWSQCRNYASGYIMIITVLVQYGVCQMILSRFMKKKLDLLMECMKKINEQNLANALEIERKSLEKVSRSDQLKVDLITNVSHDLKTPLTSMVGYIELMKKEDLNDTTRDYIDIISDKAEKLKEMIESLFSLAKVSSGNIELHMETIELNRLIEQIYADMEDRIRTSDLQFVMQLTEADTTMVTDNMYLYRVCQNLIENALKYSAKGTRVFIKTEVENRNGSTGQAASGKESTNTSVQLNERKIYMEITNTAGYFMDFNKEDIVERFARADKQRTTEGNGLGLAIVSTYTGALGGEFDICIDCDQFKAKLVFQEDTKVE